MQCLWCISWIYSQTFMYPLMNYSIHRGKKSSFLSFLDWVSFQNPPTDKTVQRPKRHLVADMVVLKTLTEYKTAIIKWSQWPSGMIHSLGILSTVVQVPKPKFKNYFFANPICMAVIIISWWHYLASSGDYSGLN